MYTMLLNRKHLKFEIAQKLGQRNRNYAITQFLNKILTFRQMPYTLDNW